MVTKNEAHEYNKEGKHQALQDVARNAPSFPENEYFVHKSNPDESDLITHEAYSDSCRMKYYVMDKQGKGVRMFCKFKKGHVEEPHFHLQRYEWIVISGKYRVTNPITGKTDIVKGGDYYCNPGGVPHQSECLEDGTLIWLYDGIPDTQCIEHYHHKDQHQHHRNCP